jgi:hypothetical protein
MLHYIGTGINYPNDTSITPLTKCLSDVELAAAYFDTLGFCSLLLRNEQATGFNIMRAINNARALAANVTDPSIVIYHQSSHGLQVRDRDGDEYDGMDEAVCTYDTYWDNKENEWQHVLTDDEFHTLFSDFPPSVLVLGVFDTCHSGSISRTILPTRRYAYRRDGSDHASLPGGATPVSANRRQSRDGFIETSFPYVILAGASSDGYSYEDRLGGLLTRSLISELRTEAKPPSLLQSIASILRFRAPGMARSAIDGAPAFPSRKKLIANIIRRIRAAGYHDQTPHYECTKHNFTLPELSVKS